MSSRTCHIVLASALLASTLTSTVGAQVIDGNIPSGNVDQVTQIGPDEYELDIRPDGGASNKQWFHFAVSQASGRTLTFHVLDFDISAPWAAGMTPCVSDDLTDETSWTRVPPADTSFASWDLTFSYTFPDDGTYHFAYAHVYPVERAQDLVATAAASPFATQRVLTQSLQGRDVDLLEITEGDAPDKLGIWVQARQHPAECGSSWTCEGFVEWLVGSSIEAQALRRGAVVRVVPMMNPDGVALGNYRRNSLGLDLNREWDDATPQTAPSVAAALTELADFDTEVGLDVFLDLHTHSSELRNWVYGVDGDPAFDLAERGWPQELEAHEPDFSYAQSSFSNGDAWVAKNQVHLLHADTLSYTHEQTYHTITYGPNADVPVTVDRYVAMGEAIGTSLVSFFELPLEPWSDLGHALAGTHGDPLNTGTGTLVGGAPFSLGLSNALEATTAYLVVGLGELNAPFKGGVLVPDPTPPGFFIGLPTGAGGSALLADVWPVGFPPGFHVVVQWWVIDGQGPAGFAASNGLRGTTP
jgi:hypothetical protein